ncbi:GntR family transcriptional regulator (plasmid) [Skermanella mucosa]|uniref:GntR family transcriptional regulator n=1 Tax=Skermanella mucosa TaxID=1789672 RepID=UPI00192BCD7B|nr:GntR family transcriptional regulator [Skermanella mucosa]UEM25220.1 GntR family transcriptional regulator [Skermanella mucosa]
MGSLKVELKPLDTSHTLKMRAYQSLKSSIEAMDPYSHRGEIRIDEREISERLGISRTPVREALILLEHEGFVRTVPRRGVVVVRKTRSEIIDMIIVWAALESMSARLFAACASDGEIAALASRLRQPFDGAEAAGEAGQAPGAADGIMEIHDAFVGASGCGMIGELTKNLRVQMRWINRLAGHAADQAARVAVLRHGMAEAIGNRDAGLAGALIRDHNLGLAGYIEKNCDFPD